MSGVIHHSLAEAPVTAYRRDSFSAEFLECGICFSTFIEPKFLPCVHTFCKTCLSGYIASVCSTHNPRFNCPTCRDNIEIPDPRAPISQWADQFKHNFLINNLLGIVAGGGGEGSPLHNPHHGGRACYKHPGKPLDFFCVDCDLMICASCAPTLHRACLQVLTLEEVVEEKKVRVRQFHQTFTAHLSRSEVKMAEQEKEKTTLQMQYSMEKQKILQQTAMLMRKLKEAENKCIEELDMANNKLGNEMDAELEEHKSRVTFLKKLRDAAGTIVTGSDPHRAIEQYNALEKYCVKLSSYKEKTFCDVQVRKMRFDVHNPTFDLNTQAIGKLNLESSTRRVMMLPIATPPPSPGLASPAASPATPKTPVQSGDVSPFHGLTTGQAALEFERMLATKLRGDRKHPCLRDGVVVAGGVLVVTDEENMCAKSFYTHGSKEMHSKLVMEKKPHSICNYVGNMVAVTVPKAKHIAIVSVCPNLILQQTVKTSAKYWAISAVGTDALAVSTCPGTSEVSIHIIDLEGNILKDVHTGKNLFANPLYLCTLATNDIMVSDCTVPKATCLRQNGHVMFNCQPGDGCSLKKPMGMADDRKGFFFLVDSQPALVLVDYSGVIKHFTGRGEGIKDPKGVAIGPKGSVYVINENGNVGIFRTTKIPMSPDATIPKQVVR